LRVPQSSHARVDANRVENVQRIGPERDARADFAGRGRALEQLDVDTGLPQRGSGRKPADSAADDQSLQG